MKKISKIKKYVSFSLVFMPFLHPYFFPGTTTNLETVWLIFNGLFFLGYNFIKSIKPVFPLSLKVFLMYSLIIPIYGYTIFGSIGGVKSSWVTIIPFLLFLINAVPLLSWKHVHKYYRILVYLSIVLFVIQEVMYSIVGYRITAYLPFLPISYSTSTTALYSALVAVTPRSMSFFLEPAHFAQYLLGYLALILGNNMSRKTFFGKESIFITIILILTWSGNAIIGTFILWVVYTILYKTTLLRKSLIFITAILVGIMSFVYISGTEKGEKLLNRQTELSVDQNRISSGTVRIFRGFFVYSRMPINQQIFGVGTGYTHEIIEKSPYNWMFEDDEYYLNTVQTLLVGTGIIGTFMFLIFLLSLVKCKSQYPKLYISLLITLMFMESFYCSGRMLIYLSLALYAYSNSKRNNIHRNMKTAKKNNGIRQ